MAPATPRSSAPAATPPPEAGTAPWAVPALEVARATGTDPDAGLTGAEAARRLRVHGPNDLPRERPRGPAASVLAQLRETMILVLLGAALLTVVTGDWADTAVITGVIVLNTAVGVAQERRAVGAVEALRALGTPHATVVRDRHPARVPAPDVVPGDLLLVAEGDVVAADARLLDAVALQVDESLLTGESHAVDRDPDARCPAGAGPGDRPTTVHAGTLVVHGTGRAVVVRTGSGTELGRVAALLRERAAPATPLQRRLAALGRTLSLIAALSCAAVAGLGILSGQPWELMVLTGISLAVAAIPESLPAVVALALAAATRRMATRGAIVRSLPAVEALGSVTVLAVDKTGTLTVGGARCAAVWTPGGGVHELDGPGPVPEGVRAVLADAALCSDAAPGAPGTEGAIVDAAVDAGIDVDRLRADRPRTLTEPFDAVRRSMRVLLDDGRGGGGREIVKGAPEVLLTGDDGAETLRSWTAGGARVLAVLAGPPGAPQPVGLLRLTDPVRPDAPPAVAAARVAGIRTVMITGDHPDTAAAVARATGILGPDDPPPDPARPLRAVYARTDPAGKLDIVAAWHRAGHLVAMTGDGVNDAPALRAADVGVAMGRRGTEVAKEAADIVLTDDGLGTIVAAVAEGRRVADNVRRFVRYGLSGGLAELLVMFLGPLLLGLALPLSPGQILWVNLVTHGLPGVAIGSEAAEPDVLTRPPRPPSEGVLTRRTTAEVVVLAVVLTACCLGVAAIAAAAGWHWRTMLFTTLAVAQLGIALSTRADRTPFWRLSPSTNPFLFAAVASSLAATAAAVYLPGLSTLLGTEPLGPAELGLALAAALVPALLVDVVELVRDRHDRRSAVAVRDLGR